MAVPSPAESDRGLTSTEAARRRAAFGANAVPSADRRGAVQRLAAVATEPMVLLLVAATAIYIAFGDVAEAIALGASLLVIVTITLVQERRTERALDALRELASPRARVLRDGTWADLDAREVVPGDHIHLVEGDRVPADGVIRAGSPLSLDESLLTGESVPVIRIPGAAVFAGTMVTTGNATAEVVHTGPRTELGRIGASLGSIELARAPLQREIARVVRRVAAVAVVLCVALGAIYVALGHGWVGAALAAIALAMSLLPEELPLVLAVFLALGAWRLARRRILARRAAAIETLGAVTVLCVDKTGTLTRNRMAIQRIVTSIDHSVADGARELPEASHAAIEFGLLACPRQPADPMDRAFATLAADALHDTEHVHPRWRWVREYPLSPELLAVTHEWRDGDRTVIATKGAPEAILDLCHLAPDAAARWRATADGLAGEGLRVLGIARAFAPHAGAAPHAPHDYAFELVGLVGLADPLRDDTAAAIASCRDAGIRIVMITGDHPATAVAIARAAGLDAQRVMTGAELDAHADAALADALAGVGVIARAAPAHKLRIVQALRARGEVVAMTGDGVNDAPALRAADVGIAMGHGTDVAREAAGLVILDDSLAAIAAAVRAGRAIYDNLRKVAAYLLAVHIPIAALALIPPLVGWPVVFAPIHIVFLELVIDPTCSVVFELEPPEAGVMRRPPRRRGEHLFDRRGIGSAIVLGLAAVLGPLIVLAAARGAGMDAATARAATFVALVAADLGLALAALEPSGRRDGGGRNPATRWMVGGVAALLAAVVLVPGARALFGFAALAPLALAVAVIAGAGPVLAVRWIRRHPRAAPAPGSRRRRRHRAAATAA